MKEGEIESEGVRTRGEGKGRTRSGAWAGQRVGRESSTGVLRYRSKGVWCIESVEGYMSRGIVVR